MKKYHLPNMITNHYQIIQAKIYQRWLINVQNVVNISFKIVILSVLNVHYHIAINAKLINYFSVTLAKVGYVVANLELYLFVKKMQVNFILIEIASIDIRMDTKNLDLNEMFV